MKFGTMKMTPEFMAEMDTMDPKRGKTIQMFVMTDGSAVSREEVDAEVREWVQSRIDRKCKTMKSFPEEGRPRITADDFLAGLEK